ncbi:MAG: C40 family peptidase [Candidatus Krumholzibacteria bacterium]|nr:C40 family peptidase [Candidatus Krumholzibacteria bacterium]MDP6797696.1 C40 family peptidase [Candidatus Krumholzibacteria bacterium]MDP7021166.1 C40 family peptidase [Candidatus Krumholzibacteria bacterium]
MSERTGIVRHTSASIRREARHEAEQISQLLLGESVLILDAVDEGRWLKVQGPDAYEGWLRSWHLQEGAPLEAGLWQVTSRWSHAYAEEREDSGILQDLSFGTRLPEADSLHQGFLPELMPRTGLHPWRLPGGQKVWTPRRHLAPLGSPGEGGVKALVRRGFRLLGIPYEWGGRSSSGMDCSGLQQLLFASLGICLPRDSRLQVEGGEALNREDPGSWEAGDLLFFGEKAIDHVALYLGEGRILHASGEVRCEELTERGELSGSGRSRLSAVRRLLS